MFDQHIDDLLRVIPSSSNLNYVFGSIKPTIKQAADCPPSNRTNKQTNEKGTDQSEIKNRLTKPAIARPSIRQQFWRKTTRPTLEVSSARSAVTAFTLYQPNPTASISQRVVAHKKSASSFVIDQLLRHILVTMVDQHIDDLFGVILSSVKHQTQTRLRTNIFSMIVTDLSQLKRRCVILAIDRIESYKQKTCDLSEKWVFDNESTCQTTN